MPQATTLGGRLRARRLELDLTLAEVAEKSGLSIPYISNLERGRGNPTIDALGALARTLEVPLTSLIGDTPIEDADVPKSLTSFSRSERFRSEVLRLANLLETDPGELRSRLVAAMASAPRRSSGEPTEDDWRRLLDVYSFILRE
jgi:transcriptional regulator with XRE-family HTH domain